MEMHIEGMREAGDVVPEPCGEMMIRRFVVDDAPRVCEIFYRSVREIACALYSREQIEAWAPTVPDSDRWLPNLLEYKTFVATNDEGIVSAWISMTDEGYIDMLFCLPEAVGKGFAARLYATVEREAIVTGIQRLTAHASLLAQPFFAKHGWIVEKHEHHVRNGVALPRAEMSKTLNP